MLKKYTKGFNKVVLFLTMADVFAWGPFFIISALSGIYLSNKLGTGSIEFVGIGTAIYFLTRAITQLPIGYITDKIKKDKDEIIILIAGIILMGFPYILYPLISTPMHYYILQFVFGLGVSLNIANWRKLFAMNIDSGREGRQYSFYETIVSLSTVILSVAVGLIANMGDMYFDLVMIASGILMMAGSIWVVLIFKFPKRKTNHIK
ncbi:MAG TPA: MFS transporter [Candidatus Dojkabacteria bacterium]|nr:MFS transporter [Candidatus Dojkabacteria bacterium]HOT60953.1 MFS transporter [Candidatus Dojkabacteria bacterium]